MHRVTSSPGPRRERLHRIAFYPSPGLTAAGNGRTGGRVGQRDQPRSDPLLRRAAIGGATGHSEPPLRPPGPWSLCPPLARLRANQRPSWKRCQEAGPRTTRLTDGSVAIFFAWERFADPPSFQLHGCSVGKSARLKAFAGNLHAACTIDRSTTVPPNRETLATPALGLLVTPSEGFEVGYVPVVIRRAAGRAPRATACGATGRRGAGRTTGLGSGSTTTGPPAGPTSPGGRGGRPRGWKNKGS